MITPTEVTKEGFLKIWDALPRTWEVLSYKRVLKIGFVLKIAGVDWRTMEDLDAVLACLHKAGALEVEEESDKFRRVAVRETEQG